MTNKKGKSFLPEKFSVLLNENIKKFSLKRGFFEPRMIYDWHLIVGEELAKYSYPKRLSYVNRKKKDAVLHISASNSSIAMNIEYKKGIIIENISVYFGLDFIKSIKVFQYPQFESNLPKEDPVENNQEISLDKRKKLDEIICNIEDPDLKEVLFSLGNSVL